MYFLLSVLTTGVLGYFMPQWMHNLSWGDLFALIDPNSTSSKIEGFLSGLGITGKTVREVAMEKLILTIAVVVAIFIGMIIITTIIKKAVNKK